MALLGMFNVHRHGAINSAAIVLYALTSCVSGYVSCGFYTQIHGERWVWNIILTSSLFSGESGPDGSEGNDTDTDLVLVTDPYCDRENNRDG